MCSFVWLWYSCILHSTKFLWLLIKPEIKATRELLLYFSKKEHFLVISSIKSSRFSCSITLNLSVVHHGNSIYICNRQIIIEVPRIEIIFLNVKFHKSNFFFILTQISWSIFFAIEKHSVHFHEIEKLPTTNCSIETSKFPDQKIQKYFDHTNASHSSRS